MVARALWSTRWRLAPHSQGLTAPWSFATTHKVLPRRPPRIYLNSVGAAGSMAGPRPVSSVRLIRQLKQTSHYTPWFEQYSLAGRALIRRRGYFPRQVIKSRSRWLKCCLLVGFRLAPHASPGRSPRSLYLDVSRDALKIDEKKWLTSLPHRSSHGCSRRATCLVWHLTVCRLERFV